MNNNIQKLLRYPKIIKLLLEYPQRSFTPYELSKLTDIPYPTAWRYVHDLRDLDVIYLSRIGRYNICKLNQSSPITSELGSIIELEAALGRLKGEVMKE
jgi:hypothetical protein